MSQNRCVVMERPGQFRHEIRSIPEIGDHDVLVRIEYVGICGSDVHLFQTGKQGENIADEPMILGHEAAGTVAAVGSNVRNLRPGDRVAIEPGETCGSCFFCKSGKYNLCPHMIFPSTPPVDGAFCEYMRIPSGTAFKLPPNVSSRDGALMEPLSIGLQNTKRGNVGLGDRVVIVGAGTIGLMNVLCCKMRGASEIIVIGRNENKLKIAASLGATARINSKQEDAESLVLDLTEGRGADVVIDCSGSVEGMQICPSLVRSGGTVVLVGMPSEDMVALNITRLIWKEVNLVGSFRYDNCYPLAINAVSKGLIEVDTLITHEFALEDLSEAFQFVIDSKNEVIKAVVKI